jgi:hypothetical protein
MKLSYIKIVVVILISFEIHSFTFSEDDLRILNKQQGNTLKENLEF